MPVMLSIVVLLYTFGVIYCYSAVFSRAEMGIISSTMDVCSTFHLQRATPRAAKRGAGGKLPQNPKVQ